MCFFSSVVSVVVPQKQRESSGSAEFVFYVPEFVLPDVSTVLRRAASADTGFICSVIAGYSFDFTSVLYFSDIDNRAL